MKIIDEQKFKEKKKGREECAPYFLTLSELPGLAPAWGQGVQQGC